MATTTTDLAVDLGVSEGDVDVLLEQMGVRVSRLSDELAGFLRQVLDPHGERSGPTGLYWPRTRKPQAYGLGGPDPTAAEEDELFE